MITRMYHFADDHPVTMAEALAATTSGKDTIDSAYATLAEISLGKQSRREVALQNEDVKIIFDTRGGLCGTLSTHKQAGMYDFDKAADVSERYRAGHESVAAGSGDTSRKREHESLGRVCTRKLGPSRCTCSNCIGPILKYSRLEGQIMETNVPLKKRKQRPTNALIDATANRDLFRGYHSRLSLTRDIFEMERMVKEVAAVIDSRPCVWHDPFVAFLRTHNSRIDKLRCPPCSYFNLGLCEYERVHTHPTRGQAHGVGKPFVGERAHICAVCFAQKMTSPHRVTRCPVVRELDTILLREWKDGNMI